MHTLNTKLINLFVIVIAFILLSSCAYYEKYIYIPYKKSVAVNQPEVGAVHIAVLSVSPWDKYSEKLQPEFEMTPDKALAEVLPTTKLIDEKMLSTFALGLKAALPTATETVTSKMTSETGSDAKTATSVTKEKKPGDISSVVGGVPKDVDKAASALTNLQDNVNVDPMAKYLAATALYQEVNLLNKYVSDAAIRSDCDAYIVRLQISLLPKKHGLPYDTYTMLSFFDNDQIPYIHPVKSEEKERKKNAKEITPSVIPLLVTDNLENILRSRSEERIGQYTAALSALLSGVGISSNVQSAIDKLRSERGKDINSLLTLARVSDNTLLVRLGAKATVGEKSTEEYEIVPRTHNITVLLMVPRRNKCDNKSIKILAKSIMTHAKYGFDLPDRSWDDVTEACKRLISHFYRIELGKEDIKKVLLGLLCIN